MARSGRPGPVVVDLPKDIQLSECEYINRQDRHGRRYKPIINPEKNKIIEVAKLLVNAKKPIIYGGGGIFNSGPEASNLLRELVDLVEIPTTLTLIILEDKLARATFIVFSEILEAFVNSTISPSNKNKFCS